MHSTSDRRSPCLLGGDEGGDQIVGRIVAPALDQRARPFVELLAGALDRVELGHQAGRVELALDEIRPLVELGRVIERRAHDRRDRQRRVGLGEGGHEVAAALAGERFPEPSQVLAHGRAPAVGGARGERRVDQVAQAPVLVAVHVQDVAAHLLQQRALAHLEHLRDLHAREGGRARAQEEGRRLAVEHEEADRRCGQPGACGQVGHHLVKAIALQLGTEVVELRQLHVGHEGHLRQQTVTARR